MSANAKNTRRGSSGIVRHTSDELRAMIARGESRTDWDYVRTHAADTSDPDADECGPDMASELARLRGRPLGSGRKAATSIRIDKDVLAAFRATGPGWQTRMNDALRAWLERRRSPTRLKKRRAAK